MSKKYEVPDMQVTIEIDYHKMDAESEGLPAPALTLNFPVFHSTKDGIQFVGTESRSVLLTRDLTYQLIDDFYSIMSGAWEPFHA